MSRDCYLDLWLWGILLIKFHASECCELSGGVINVIFYTVFILTVIYGFLIAPYEFLHDITCLLKKPFKSQYRQAVVSRFWTTLKNLSRSDQLLVHLSSFPSNPATYTIPESIRSGMPVFYLPANSSIPVLSSRWDPVVSFQRIIFIIDKSQNLFLCHWHN
jgi:hypothetical protein